MKSLINKLSALKFWQKGLIAGILVVSTIVAFHQIHYTKITTELNDLKAGIDDLETKIADAQRTIRNLSQFQEDVRKLDEKLAIVLRELPDRKNVEEFLRSISNLAIDTGLEVLEFSPQPESPEQFFAKIPVKLVLEGTFHQLATFFDEIGHLPRIVNLREISTNDMVTKDNSDEIVIRVSCIATTYRYIEDRERSGGNDSEKRSKDGPRVKYQ